MRNNNRFIKKNKADNFKRFRGNKSEGQGFADKRKKKAQYEYMKLLKKQRKNQEETALKLYADNETSDTETKMQSAPRRKQQNKKNAYSKAQVEYTEKKKRKDIRKKEALEQKRAVESALEKYGKRKQTNYKLLCKRTHRGQPVMKHQIEYLLEKIKKQKEVT